MNELESLKGVVGRCSSVRYASPIRFLAITSIAFALSGARLASSNEWTDRGPAQAESSRPLDRFAPSSPADSIARLAAVASEAAELQPDPPERQSLFATDPPRELTVSNGDICSNSSSLQLSPPELHAVRAGYDNGFVIASEARPGTDLSDAPFLLRMNGLGQLRHTLRDSEGENVDLNQFQLIRGRLIFSGNAFTPDLNYFVQLDGRSSSGDELRLLDYRFDFDLGHHYGDLEKDVLVFKTGKYKIPFSLARDLSAREFEFADRSMSSTYFDINRSFACGFAGELSPREIPVRWETAVFNGLVTGGAETGSSGSLDTNFAYSARIFIYPTGTWGTGSLADFDWHDRLGTRIGAAYAGSTISRIGTTEFNSIRVVDTGDRLSNLLPAAVDEFSVNTYCVDASCKFRGWSLTGEYYFRMIDGFQGEALPDLFDHGFWLQVGKFVVPEKLQLLSRWSRVVGSSGTLGFDTRSADEKACGIVWYFRGQHAKLTFDATYLDGAPISSSALDIAAGDIGWLLRTQIQLAF